MRTLLSLIYVLLVYSSALAQQQPDPSLIRRIIPLLQQQRNEASDRAALSEAKAAQLSEEIEQLKAQLAKAKEDKRE
jgi:hypothetical protein